MIKEESIMESDLRYYLAEIKRNPGLDGNTICRCCFGFGTRSDGLGNTWQCYSCTGQGVKEPTPTLADQPFALLRIVIRQVILPGRVTVKVVRDRWHVFTVELCWPNRLPCIYNFDDLPMAKEWFDHLSKPDYIGSIDYWADFRRETEA